MFSHFVRMAAGYLTYLVGGGETPPPVGTLWVFGNNTNGELGDNTTASKSSPIQTVAGGNDWTVVDGYNAFSSAAIKDDGSLWLWGSDTYGQLGDNSTTNKSSPVQTVSGGTDWAKVECGYHTVAVKTDGTLWTWGKDQYGQLGDNTTTNKSSPVQTVAGGTDWADVSCGYGESAAIKTDGTLWTWGGNSSGQLGDNTRTNKSSPVQTVAGGTDWKQCDLGSFFMGAIKTDGTLWTWGANSQGSLGDNTTAAKSSPVQTVAGGTDWKQLSCGGTHAAAIKTDGTLWLWGQNNNGQLGDNSSTRKSSPVQTVAGGTDWKYVSCGSNHTMAVKTDGTLWGWGDGYYGQLGNDSYGFGARRSSPVQTVAGGTKWGYVTAGHRHTLAIVTVLSGSIWSWGDNTYGELGDNSTTDKSSPVQTLITTEDWITVSRGNNHTAAIRRDGTLWVWGRNDLGQLGDNTTTPKSSPVQTVAGGTDWADVVCGTHHVLAMKNDGSLWTWGYNNNGELGDNTTTNKSSPVQTVAGGTNWATLAKSCTGASAAIKTDGTLWLWGLNNQGQLGDNSNVKKSSPVQTVAGGTDWASVSSSLHTVAIKTDGTLWAWGDGPPIGDGTSVDKSSPVQTVSGGTDWVSAGTGSGHTIAVKTDGTLWTWGFNTYGELGDNSRTTRNSPVQTVAGGTDWKIAQNAQAGGNDCSAAIKQDGTVWNWGWGGALGSSTIQHRSSPVQITASGGEWFEVEGGYWGMSAIQLPQ